MFDNALPPAYSTIRRLIRQHNNTNFANHIQMYMSQVKAELACRQPVPHAFATFGTVLPHAPSPGGRGQGGRKGGGRGGRGAGGKGRGTGTTLNPCLRCLLTNHTRPQCNKQTVQCQYCGADHHHTICFHASAPGGARRDSLSPGAAALVRRECGAPTHSTALSTVANSTATQNIATANNATLSEMGDGTESQAASTAGTSQLTHSIAAQSAAVTQWPPAGQPGVGRCRRARSAPSLAPHRPTRSRTATRSLRTTRHDAVDGCTSHGPATQAVPSRAEPRRAAPRRANPCRCRRAQSAPSLATHYTHAYTS